MDNQLDEEFGRLLSGRHLDVEFQPIVALWTDEVVGFEAFARGPRGTALELSESLFAAARRTGRLAELDWVSRAVAFQAFAQADVPAAMSLCVDVVPESLATDCPPDLAEAVSRAESLLRVFVQVDDKALAADPAGLVRAVDRARASGWGVAVTDIGGARTSLAALPVVGADLVKVDMSLLRQRDRADVSAITLSVLKHIELSGAGLLVQGVEDADDAAWARALGAPYAQGTYYGPPGPLKDTYPLPRAAIPLLRMAQDDRVLGSALDMVSDLGTTTMTPAQLDQIAQVVYQAGLRPGASSVVLASAGARPVAQVSADEYPSAPTPPLLSVLFGTDVPREPRPGLRGVRVGAADPIATETFLVVLGEREVVAVVAAPSADKPGLVEAVITQDPLRVHHLARSLFERIPGAADRPLAPVDPGEEADDPDAVPDQAGHGRRLPWRR